VNDDDAQGFAVVDALEAALLPLVTDVTLVFAMGVHPAEHLHQGGFARAVFSHDGMDLARMDRQVDIGQRLHAME